MGDYKTVKVGEKVRMVTDYDDTKKGTIVVITRISNRGSQICNVELATLGGKNIGMPFNYRWEKLNNYNCKHTCISCSHKCDYWESE